MNHITDIEYKINEVCDNVLNFITFRRVLIYLILTSPITIITWWIYNGNN